MNEDTRENIVSAASNQELLVFDYVDRKGVASAREVEPYEFRSSAEGELLVAYDRGRQDYRSFRLSGISGTKRTGIRFQPRRPISIAA
jgi:predicted DNA-binding transcriptional regulator YafY